MPQLPSRLRMLRVRNTSRIRPLVMWLGVSREQFVKAKVEKQEAVV